MQTHRRTAVDDAANAGAVRFAVRRHSKELAKGRHGFRDAIALACSSIEAVPWPVQVDVHRRLALKVRRRLDETEHVAACSLQTSQ